MKITMTCQNCNLVKTINPQTSAKAVQWFDEAGWYIEWQIPLLYQPKILCPSCKKDNK
jgi:hypothetical protein